ncbi:RIO-like kinase [Corchorus olitorius]|uniref:non-specific serine/threonine protein kinase n=1 Tax=Corchorus olitorius TaxID=93759 RepID=A0A1R3KCK1_9ROSI|nr:RIO-like kinase [Corchorus olitorius]
MSIMQQNLMVRNWQSKCTKLLFWFSRIEIVMYKVITGSDMDIVSTILEKWLKVAGIRCPTPLLLRLHVLVMEFIGKTGWAAPRLKDAAFSLDKLREYDTCNENVIPEVQISAWGSQ